MSMDDSYEMEPELLLEFIEHIQDNYQNLDPKSSSFLDDMVERAEKYPTVYVSEKQWAWLVNLATKAGVPVPDPE